MFFNKPFIFTLRQVEKKVCLKPPLMASDPPPMEFASTDWKKNLLSHHDIAAITYHSKYTTNNFYKVVTPVQVSKEKGMLSLLKGET